MTPLPTFVVIGGMKCGSTALWHYLRNHPLIYVPERRKNLEFFLTEGNWHRGLDWYRTCFADAPPTAQAIGEISTEYTKHPLISGVAARMAGVLPEARLVYVVRDPVERLISQYIHLVNAARELRPFHIAVTATEPNPYLAFSRYHHQVEQFLPYYGEERILLVTSEALRRDPAATLDHLARFLGVEEGHPPAAPVITHTRAEKRRWNRIGRAIRRSPKAYNLYQYYVGHLPPLVRPLVHGITGRQARPPVVDDATHASLVEALAPDAEQLRARFHLETPGWQV